MYATLTMLPVNGGFLKKSVVLLFILMNALFSVAHISGSLPRNFGLSTCVETQEP